MLRTEDSGDFLIQNLNAGGIQERILEKLSVVLSGDNNKTIAENDDIAAVKKKGKKGGVQNCIK